ncbi:MAG: VCBS repeat-containing protein [Sedimentisphaerales bacterium]|nr:VCBS repeat-containing protein [Sedimentisphaerales bacterium]
MERKNVSAGLIMFVLAWTAVGALADVEPNTPSGSEGALSEYYGFDRMEILRLDWQMLPPIAVDINGDTLCDIVVVNNRRSRVELLLQRADFDPCAIVVETPKADDINDLFGSEAGWRFVRADYPLDVAVTDLIVADLNNDTLLDLAFVANERLYVVQQQSPQEAAEASEPTEPIWSNAVRFELEQVPNNTGTLAAGDLNGDDLTDLAVKTDDAVAILYQNSNNELDRPVQFPITAQRPRQIAIADIDGNGRDDLVLVTTDRDYPLRARFQDQTGRLGPEVRLEMTNPALLEFDQINDSDSRDYAVAIAAQTGRLFIATAENVEQQNEFPVFTYPLADTENADQRNTVIADIDGDGLDDIVVSDPSGAEFLLFRPTDDALLQGPQRFPGFSDMCKLVAVQTETQPGQAIVVLSKEENLIGITNYANGRLTYPSAIEISDEPVAMDVADINNNGSADMLYIAKRPQHQEYTLRSVMDFTQGQNQPGPTLELTTLESNPTDLRIMDINHDGFCDALIVRSYGPMILALQDPNGSGRFELVDRNDIHDGLVSNVFPSTLSAAPLGPDGQTAILLTQRNFARALDFDTELGWQVLDQYHPDSTGTNLTASVAYRWTDDSPLNIAVLDNAHNKLAILSAQDDGTYRQTTEIEISPIDIQAIQTARLSPDSTTLVLSAADKIVLVPSQGQVCEFTSIADFEIDTEELRVNSLAIGDINSDNTPDIVMTDRMGHHVEVVTFSPAGQLLHAMRFKVFEEFQAAGDSQYSRAGDQGEPRAVTLADVTGDGRDDIIILVHDRIIVYPQDY